MTNVITFKIILIGDTNVGKSSALLRFRKNKFDKTLSNTIITDHKISQIKIDDKTVKLLIWDISGQDRFHAIIPMYYKHCEGVILMYDITNRLSFVKLDAWLKELDKSCDNANIVKILVGNKTDLPNRQIDINDAIEFTKKYKTLYAEMSAKTADGVRNCYEKLIREMISISSQEIPEIETEIDVFDNELTNCERCLKWIFIPLFCFFLINLVHYIRVHSTFL